MKNRLHKWKKSKQILTAFTGKSAPELDKIMTTLAKNKSPDLKLSNVNIIEACKEIIFSYNNGKPLFDFIVYVINADTGCIEITRLIQSVHDDKASVEEIEENIRNTLALATALGIPVYPNTMEDDTFLKHYHRLMIIKGFTVPNDKGERLKVRLTRFPAGVVDTFNFVKVLNLQETFEPADIDLIKDIVLKEFEKYKHAQLILDTLTIAISELEALLRSSKRNESKLQKCLLRYPILFGTDYVSLLPKHKLGSEFEMDYALEKINGLYDLVEIESSNLPIFTKN